VSAPVDPFHLPWSVEAGGKRLGIARDRETAIEMCNQMMPDAPGWATNQDDGEVWCGQNGEWRRVPLPRRVFPASGRLL